jgi:hypothetical protein
MRMMETLEKMIIMKNRMKIEIIHKLHRHICCSWDERLVDGILA